ncbi:MAG: hypothetical protein GX973_05870, partial [Firmicutes bacterium]|nr:hypothetical protein [Bacillota bacterium]
ISVVLEAISYKDEDFTESNLYSQGNRYIGVCKSWADILSDCFKQESDDCCYHVQYGDKANQADWTFTITPLDVAKLFYEKVIKNSDSIILTSATLAENGNYDRIKSRLGFDRLGDRVQEVDPLAQIFNYRENCVLAVPKDSPGYKQEGEFFRFMAATVYEIAMMLGGKTLVLFSSLKRRDAVYELVRPDLEKEGIRVLCGSSQGLVEKFREGNSVLFGSKGFSEGIDVKGVALSCVIIDKLSFPYPGDPVLEARLRRTENGFREILLPQAVLTLRQQFGRLLRSENDKGFVVVMDQLRPETGYFANVRGNLPNVPYVYRPLDELRSLMKDRFYHWGLMECNR